MATVAGNLKTKFTDDLGEPLVGGKVYTYHAGTSTPKDSYQDKAFAIVNTNPIVLDDAGSCDLYLNGLYRLRILDKDGVFVEERDYMTQGDSTGSSITDNANNITVLQSEVQAINERSVLKLDEHNFIIAHGRADSATVYDPVFRADKLKLALQGQEDSARNIFKTYATDTTLNGNEIKAGTYLDPALQAVKLGTAATKNTGKGADQVPLNSDLGTAASRKAGYEDGDVALIDRSGVAGTGIGAFFSPSATQLPRYLKSGNYVYPENSNLRPPNLNRYDTQCLVLNKHAQGYGTAIWFPYGIASANNIVLEAFAASTRIFHTIYTDKNTTKDSKTNLLLESGGTVPENSAASRLVGTAPGNVLETGAFGLGRRGSEGYLGLGNKLLPEDGNLAQSRSFVNSTPTGLYKSADAGEAIILGTSSDPSNTSYAASFVFMVSGYNRSVPKYAYITSRTAFDSTKDIFAFWTTQNANKDSNGFLKGASPVVDMYDNKIDLNRDAEVQGVEFIKNGTGDYTLKTKTGLRSDNTWQIEVPQDNNKNPLFAVDIDAQDDGTINIKCYKRIFSMETFLFGPDFNEPMDITEGRFISVRLNDNPEEQLDEPAE